MRKHLCCLNTNGIFPLREARIQEHPYLGIVCGPDGFGVFAWGLE